MSFSFQIKVASSGFHIYKNTTWENVNIGQEISLQLETNEGSKKIDPYCCAIKTMVSGKLETVGHIPRKVSRHTYFYIKEERGRIDGSVLSKCYRPSPISSGGLEIPLMMTFRSLRNSTQNVESDSDSDEFHIEIKENVVEKGEDSEVVVTPKAKKRKVTIE